MIATPVTRDEVHVPEALAGQRFGAWLLDLVYGLIVMVSVAVAVGGLVGANTPREIDIAANTAAVIMIVFAPVVLAAIELFGGHGAGSLGKRTLGLRIQAWPQHGGSSSLGARLWGRFFLRNFILAIPLVNLICLIDMATRKDHRAWYDQMAGTVVVKL